MELKHFRLIKTIAEEGNIANSSEKLFLTQSALSHQLKELEERLGFKVFFRKRNHWELSEQGKELYHLANELFAKLEEGLAGIQQISNGSKGQVKIGTECYSFYHGLPSFIQKMGILYPEIEVDIELDSTHQPIPKLVSKEIDMAIATEKPSSDQLVSVELFEDEVVCILNRESHLAEEAFLQAEHFRKEHLLIHSYPLESVSVYARYLKPRGVTPQKISAIPFLSVAFEMIEVNMGVICLPANVLNSFKLSDRIIHKRIGEHGLKRINYLIFRKEDQSKKYISDFIANIQEEFAEIS